MQNTRIKYTSINNNSLQLCSELVWRCCPSVLCWTMVQAPPWKGVKTWCKPILSIAWSSLASMGDRCQGFSAVCLLHHSHIRPISWERFLLLGDGAKKGFGCFLAKKRLVFIFGNARNCLQVSLVHLSLSSLGCGLTKGEKKEKNADVDLGVLGSNPTSINKIDMEA